MSDLLPAQPALILSARPAAAPSGSEFAGKVWNLGLAERDEQIFREITSGNAPSSLRTLVPVEVTNVAANLTSTATFFVCPDYLAVGSDQDSCLFPMRPETAQRIADALGGALPTPKMVDAIWRAATLKMSPTPIAPSPAMTSVAVFSNHNVILKEQQRDLPRAVLVAGHKKDVVISSKLRAAPGRVAIYGWHRTNGVPIQPLYLGHAASWVDYSQCVRLVHREVIVNGRRMPLRNALRDASLAGLFSDEGPIEEPRYPASK